jgi:hypothetical protein
LRRGRERERSPQRASNIGCAKAQVHEATLCADSPRLVDELRSDVTRLNMRPAELVRAMGEANPLALECTSQGTSVPAEPD